MKFSSVNDEWVVGLAALAVAGCVALLELPVIISHFMVDDSFYYLEIGRNIAIGKGFTFDGLHITNGFQPLYQFLVAAVFRLTQDNEAGIRFVKALEAVILAMGAILLFRLAYKLTHSRGAAWIAAGVLFLPGPYGHPFGKGLFIGMESGINFVMLLFLLHMWIESMNGRKQARFFFLYGLVIGLTFLARLDNIFLIAGIAIHHVYFLRKKDSPNLSNLLVTAAVSSAIGICYLLWNYFQFGDIVPISGRVQNWVSQQRSAQFLALGWFDWVKNTLWFIFDIKPVALLPIIGIFGLPMLVLIQKVTTRSSDAKALYDARHFSFLLVLWITSLFKVSYYSLFHQYPRSGDYWYYVQEVILFAVCAGYVSGYVFGRLKDARWEVIARYGSLGLMALSLFSILNTKPVFEWELASYTVTRDVSRFVNEEAILGAKDAGVLGYFLPNPVVNLDGLVNDERFFEYLNSGRVGQYVLEEDIQYILNLSAPTSNDIVTSLTSPIRLELVYRSETPVVSKDNRVYKIYRVIR